MAYRQQQALENQMGDMIDNMIYSEMLESNPDNRPVQNQKYATPKWWALYRVDQSQTELNNAISKEAALLG